MWKNYKICASECLEPGTIFLHTLLILILAPWLKVFIALITALGILGIYSCLMIEVVLLTRCAEMWNDGLTAKYYRLGRRSEKKKFHKLLGNFGVRYLLQRISPTRWIQLPNSHRPRVQGCNCIPMMRELWLIYITSYGGRYWLNMQFGILEKSSCLLWGLGCVFDTCDRGDRRRIKEHD